MPWRTASIMDERIRFVLEAERGFHSFSELCRRYGISRPTGYLWVRRYEEGGLEGLRDRSHRPGSCPHATSPEIVNRILELRRHRGWGAPKLRRVIEREFGEAPCVDTVHQILRRNGMIKTRKPRRRRTHPGPPTTPMHRPNAVWTADFKGQFRMGDGNLCYPLTVQDGFSRFLLGCKALPSPNHDQSVRHFDHLFRTFGLPTVIKTDNGVPFASSAIARLSRLSVHWIKLGIRPELIEPASPHQNGRHERMHRTLKARTARPPRKDLRAQQRRFNAFRKVYNHERPHEALGQRTPASVYSSSVQTLSDAPIEISYPDHFEVRKISQDTTIRWKSQKVFVSNLLCGEHIGLEEVGEGLWSAYFGTIHLGWLDETDYRIMDVKGDKRRR